MFYGICFMAHQQLLCALSSLPSTETLLEASFEPSPQGWDPSLLRPTQHVRVSILLPKATDLYGHQSQNTVCSSHLTDLASVFAHHGVRSFPTLLQTIISAIRKMSGLEAGDSESEVHGGGDQCPLDLLTCKERQRHSPC